MRAQYRLKTRRRAWDDVVAPGRADIEAMAVAAIAAAGPELQAKARGVAIVVRDMPSVDVLDELGVDDPYDLLGYFDAVDARGGLATAEMSKMLLFRRPILDMWADEPIALGALVADVVTHELRQDAPAQAAPHAPSPSAETPLSLG